MIRRLLVGVGLLIGLVVVGLVVVKLQFGGGSPFPDVSTPPEVPMSAVEAIALDLPPGCVTVSADGRVFFDTHPFAVPGRFGAPHLFEIVDGEPVPWPSEEAQSDLVAPFGLTTDAEGRLWITEPATLDRPATRLLAFDIASGERVFEHRLPAGEARFAQDLRVSPDGQSIVLADTGAFALTPGQLLVFDIATKRIVRTFRDESLNPQDWVIRRYDGRPHRVGFGLVSFQVGVDGITFSSDGDWLYYGTMSHDTMHRLPSDALLDPGVTNQALANRIQTVGTKPQSDGIAATPDGDVLVTDVENGGLAVLRPGGELATLTKSPDVIWADSVEIAPNGEIWFTDSAIPAYLQQTLQPPPREVLEAGAPYHIYRIPAPQPVDE